MRYRPDPTLNQLAAEQRCHFRGQPGIREQVVVARECAHGAEINITLTTQAGLPALRHGGDGFRGIGERTTQGVLDATMNHALGGERLFAAKALPLDQARAVTHLLQAIHQPQTSDAATEDSDIEASCA